MTTTVTILAVVFFAVTLYLRFNTPKWLEELGKDAGSAIAS